MQRFNLQFQLSDFGLQIALNIHSDLYHKKFWPQLSGAFVTILDQLAPVNKFARIPISPGKLM